MSRTYHKIIRLGNCVGSNTEYYRKRNRAQRAKNRQILRKIRQVNIEDYANTCEFIKYPKKDSWREPTDGTWLLNKQTLINWKEQINDPVYGSWYRRMFNRFNHRIKNKDEYIYRTI